MGWLEGCTGENGTAETSPFGHTRKALFDCNQTFALFPDTIRWKSTFMHFSCLDERIVGAAAISAATGRCHAGHSSVQPIVSMHNRKGHVFADKEAIKVVYYYVKKAGNCKLFLESNRLDYHPPYSSSQLYAVGGKPSIAMPLPL